MSPKQASRAAGGGASRTAGALTPGRIAMIAVAVLTLVLVFENTREVEIRLPAPESTLPPYVALLATALLGTGCGYRFAARRRK
ncbi:hypothetical protein [Streptomyces globisporus]|uniref:hypothetical protein n=1 Tax=Streptomyces globisporus TaxID=1908 RepID=UPI0004C951E8|nr:hypothetical protein [Streptomyces globisporus]